MVYQPFHICNGPRILVKCIVDALDDATSVTFVLVYLLLVTADAKPQLVITLFLQFWCCLPSHLDELLWLGVTDRVQCSRADNIDVFMEQLYCT